MPIKEHMQKQKNKTKNALQMQVIYISANCELCFGRSNLLQVTKLIKGWVCLIQRYRDEYMETVYGKGKQINFLKIEGQYRKEIMRNKVTPLSRKETG